MTLATLQENFLNYILNGDKAIEHVVETRHVASKAMRLKVYYDAYRYRFKEILGRDFEKLHTLAGAETFEAMCEAYIESYPSSHFSARYIPQSFPKMLKNHPDFKEQSMFFEMAQFEWLMGETIDALDAPVLTLDYLKFQPPEAWPGLKFTLHPAVRLYTFTWNMPAIYQAMEADEPPRAPEQYPKPVDFIMWRNPESMQSFFSSLGDIHAIVFKEIKLGKNFEAIGAALTEIVSEEEAPTKLVELLLQWIPAGIFRA